MVIYMKKRILSLIVLVSIVFSSTFVCADSIINDGDYKKGKMQQEAEEFNTAPSAYFALKKKHKVDIAVLTDYTGTKLSDLATKLNTFKSSMYSMGVDVNLKIIDGNNTTNAGNLIRRKIYRVVNGVYEDVTDYAMQSGNTYKGWTGSKSIDDYTLTIYDTPINIDGLSNVIQVATDREYGFTLYLKYNGTVWAKGNNECGQLGDGTNINRSTPVKVKELENVVQIAAGNGMSGAITSNNEVYVWGLDLPYILTPELKRYRVETAPTYRYNTPQKINVSNTFGDYGTPVAIGMNYLFYNETPRYYFYGMRVVFDDAAFFIDARREDKSEWYESGSWGWYKYFYYWTTWGYMLFIGGQPLVPVDTKTPIKSVNPDAVKSFTLRENSDRYFIFVSNGQGDNYTSAFGNYFSFINLDYSFAEYLANNNYSIHAVCPSSTYDYISDPERQKLSVRQLVESSPKEGKLFNTGQIQQSLNSISSKYNSLDKYGTNYVLLNDEIFMGTYYEDMNNDPKHTSRWKYTHNPNYYDNSLGSIPDSGVYRASPYLSFNKVGHFKINYQVMDNPKNDSRFDGYKAYSDESLTETEIYVHRRPIAAFNVAFSGIDGSGNMVLSVSDLSYDLDHTSRMDKGIVQRVWKYKEISSASWIDGIPSTINPSKTYMIYLTVLDLEGEWSYPCMKIIENTGNYPPSVDALPISKDWTNANVTCTITATDVDGDYAYTNYMWSTSPVKPTSGWTKNTSSSFNVTQSTQGSWYLHMEAFDAVGNSFYRMRGPYNIDKTPPSGVFNPNTHSWTNKDVSVTFDPSDTGGSGVKQWRYRVSTNNGSTYGSWSGYITGDTNGMIVLKDTGSNRIQAEIQDNAGNIGTVTSGTYYIDKIAPVVNANPATLTSYDPITVTLTAADTGGSGLKQTNYKWTTTTAKPASGWLIATAGSFSTTLSDDSSEFYLHVEAFDNAGNSTYRVFGPYKYESLKITGVTISGYWNHWRGQVDMFGKRMTNEPHRFLSLERVKINVYTSGYADRVEIRFSPELEAMQYTDIYGNVYDYNRDYDLSYVYFPQTFALDNTQKDGHIYWEYILPLANSTKSWDDRRLRPPYSMTVTAYKGEKSVVYTISDIDITGNIFDLIYIQPVD